VRHALVYGGKKGHRIQKQNFVDTFLATSVGGMEDFAQDWDGVKRGGKAGEGGRAQTTRPITPFLVPDQSKKGEKKRKKSGWTLGLPSAKRPQGGEKNQEVSTELTLNVGKRRK